MNMIRFDLIWYDTIWYVYFKNIALELADFKTSNNCWLKIRSRPWSRHAWDASSEVGSLGWHPWSLAHGVAGWCGTDLKIFPSVRYRCVPWWQKRPWNHETSELKACHNTLPGVSPTSKDCYGSHDHDGWPLVRELNLSCSVSTWLRSLTVWLWI